MRKRHLKRIFASLLTAVMLFSIFSPSAFAVGSEDDNLEKTADALTTTSYLNNFGDSTSTRYTGRIWTDKSVSSGSMTFQGSSDTKTVDIGASDFLVAYSALATSTTVTTETPVDVSFILDFSASMNWDVEGEEVAEGNAQEAQAASRLQAMVDSLNEAISMLVKSNDHNRIAVTVFNGSATQLLPLTEVSTISESVSENSKFFEITSFKPKTSSSGKREADATVCCNINNQSASTAGGTNIQSGLYEGMRVLADAEKTTYDANGKTVTRIPNVILMSDGAPTTFSSATNANYTDKEGHTQIGTITNDTSINPKKKVTSGSWWNSLNTAEAIGSGDNDNPDSADGFMALLTAAYWKDRITDHYYSGSSSGETANVYTIGFSTNLQTDDMVEMTNLVLNPAENIDAQDIQNDQVKDVQTAWDHYAAGKTVTVEAPIGKGNNSTFVTYTVQRADETIDDIVYTDQYYSAEDAGELYQAFSDIIGQITAQAKLPTEHGSMDPTESGYLTYVDPIGEYMQVDDVKAILWNDHLFTTPSIQKSQDGKTTTYTFTGEIQNPAYTQENNLDNIIITVTEDGSGNQTVQIKIPAAAIPLRVNEVTLEGDKVTSNECNNAYPVRIFYGLSLKDGVIQENDSLNYEMVSEQYIKDHLSNGKVSFYTNTYSGNSGSANPGSQDEVPTIGDAYVTFTPAQDNPFYYIQEDTQLFLDQDLTTPVTENIDPTGTYYFQIEYYQGLQRETDVVARSGSLLPSDYIIEKSGNYYLAAGAPRLGNLNQFVHAKDEGNNQTGTASTYYYPTYENGAFKVYLGNNGRVDVDVYGDLTISKTVTGDNAPEGAKFTFQVNLNDESGTPLSGSYSYTSSGGITGTIKNGDTVTLEADQSITIQNLPAGCRYTVDETNIPSGFTANQDSQSDVIPVNDTAEAAFTNTYASAPVTLSASECFQVTKTLVGREWQIGDSFTFTLTGADDTVPMPAVTTITIDADDENHTSSFGSITYTEAGTYNYTIQENAGSDSTLNYDTHTASVTVQIADDGLGNLYVKSVTYDNAAALTKNDTAVSNAAAFTNAAKPTVTPGGTKVMQGTTHALSAGDFEFVLERYDQEDNTWKRVDTKTNGDATTVGSDQQASFQFAEQTLEAGETKFLITEDQGNAGGVTYDTSAYVVTYTVARDAETGAYGVTSQIEKYSSVANAKAGVNGTVVSGVVFTNSYKVSGKVTATLGGTKTLTGRALQADEFTFAIKAVGAEEPLYTTTNQKDGSFVFPELTFETVGTYQYTVYEVPGNSVGITYDTTVYKLTIQVTDNGNGGLAISYCVNDGTPSTDAPDFNFKNSYTTQKNSLILKGTKTLTGDTTLSADQFSFSVYATDQNGNKTGAALATGTNAADGSVTFSAIDYSSEGNHTLWVEENDTGAAGVIYDKNHYLVQVEVTDPQTGSYQIAVTGVTKVDENGNQSTVDYADGQGLSFRNRYEPAAAELKIPVTKTLSGRTMQAGEFSFLLVPTGTLENDPVTEDGITATVDAAGQAAFHLNYEHTGVYEYTISEVNTQLGGVSYDQKTYTIQVKVTDEGGSLQADYSITKGGDSLSFANSYSPQEVTIQVNGTKSTQAAEGAVPDNYSFSYVVKDNAAQTVFTGNSDANGAFSFDLTFHAAGTYNYTIAELDSGASSGDNPGITYDNSTYSLTVTVTDDGNGILTADYDLADANGNPCTDADFTNTYDGGTTELDLTLALNATKELTGRALQAGEFHFVVLDENGVEVATGQNDADGNITFGNLYYDESDYGDHSYTVHEVVPTDGAGPGGIIYDSSNYSFSVTVTDNGDGTMSADAEVPESIVFQNSYQASEVQVSLSAQKTLDGMQLTSGMFSFLLEDENGQLLAQVTNGNNDDPSAVVFRNLTFNAEMMGGATERTFHYTVKEMDTGRAGISYDQRVYDVAITVRDDGNGKLMADAPVITCNGQTVNAIVFQNSYRPAEATLSLTGTKTLNGRELADGEFGFTVDCLQADGSWNTVATAINQGQSINFTPITFDATGEYTLRVYENNGGMGGVQYDDSVYYVTVNVTDQGNDGQMDAVVTNLTRGTADETGSTAKEIAFVNDYQPAAVTVTLNGTKVLEGKDLTEGEFAFYVSDAEGNVVSSGKNDANGTIRFSDMTFTQAGDYTLTVWEEQGSADHVTYDGTRYTVIIHVVDYSGVLSATVEYPDGDVVFHNTYEGKDPDTNPDQPTKPDTSNTPTTPNSSSPASGGIAGPQTGDQMPVVSIVVIALVAACVLALLLVLGKQRKNRK